MKERGMDYRVPENIRDFRFATTSYDNDGYVYCLALTSYIAPRTSYCFYHLTLHSSMRYTH